MERSEIKIGSLYNIAGQGPMQALDLHSGSVECRTIAGLTYWAGYAQVTREVTRADVDAHAEALKARGIVPADFQPEI